MTNSVTKQRGSCRVTHPNIPTTWGLCPSVTFFIVSISDRKSRLSLPLAESVTTPTCYLATPMACGHTHIMYRTTPTCYLATPTLIIKPHPHHIEPQVFYGHPHMIYPHPHDMATPTLCTFEEFDGHTHMDAVPVNGHHLAACDGTFQVSLVNLPKGPLPQRLVDDNITRRHLPVVM